MSAQEEIGETQGTNDGNDEGQKPQEGEPPGEIAEEPTQVLDQDGAGDDISVDPAQATNTVKEGDDEEEKVKAVDTNDDPTDVDQTEGMKETPVEEKTEEDSRKMEEAPMSVVISEPDKDVETQESNAQTEGRESPVGDADVSSTSPGKVEDKVVETKSESESPLVAPPTSKADRSVDSETPMKDTRDQLESGGIARDGFSANG